MSLADTTTTAQQLVHACLLGSAGLELLLWMRTRGGKTAPDLTFALVVAAVAAGINLAFRTAHEAGHSNRRRTSRHRGRSVRYRSRRRAPNLGDPHPGPLLQVRGRHSGRASRRRLGPITIRPAPEL